MSKRKHIEAVERIAAEFDCVVVKARRAGHLHIRDAETLGLVGVAPLSPGDHRGLANLRSALRRATMEGGR